MAEKFDPKVLEKLGLSASDVEAATAEEKASNDQLRPSLSYWKDAFRRFRRNKLAIAMSILLLIILLLAIFGPIVSPYTYKGQSADVRQGPSLSHPLGTDKLGRDIFVRLMYGTRISLLVGFVTMILVCLIGITYGAVAAYVGGIWDNLMMRFVDLMMTIPSMLIHSAVRRAARPAEGADRQSAVHIAGLLGLRPDLHLYRPGAV